MASETRGAGAKRIVTHTCKCHCSTCGRCFNGITAFDAHRVGNFSAGRLSIEGRRCVDPSKRPDDFRPRDGECRMEGTSEDATIWGFGSELELALFR